jgi:hypothetical protein
MAHGTERTIGQLVADATHDLEGIVRGEIALAKAEITDGAKVMGRGAGLLAGAAFLGLMGLVFLFHTLAQVIGIWLPLWAGYAIVTAVLVLVAAILAMVGRKALQDVNPTPERAIDQGKQTLAALKREPEAPVTTATGATPAASAPTNGASAPATPAPPG